MTSAWLNRTVIGAGLTSFLADVGYELATALIPSFLLVIGIPPTSAPAVMGSIEAAAEFLSNAAKLLVGWWSDRIGQRKAMVVFGYGLTGSAFALCALAASWPLIMLAKSLGWLGKGIRGPLRNAIISDAVDPGHHGKAFGFHRAGDALGSVLGPILAVALLSGLTTLQSDSLSWNYRLAFLFTLIPGLGSAIVFACLVREKRFRPKPGLRLGASLRSMPGAYRRYLGAVFVFGLGDFAHTLLILAATSELTDSFARTESLHSPSSAVLIGLLLYAWRNFTQTLASFPAGWLGDRVGHRRMLVIGYLLGAATMCGFALLMALAANWVLGWFLLFTGAGTFMAIQESLEPAIVPEMVPDKSTHGTAYGVLAFVNGLGDVLASLVVGFLVAGFGWGVGLTYAAVLMTVGALSMAIIRK